MESASIESTESVHFHTFAILSFGESTMLEKMSVPGHFIGVSGQLIRAPGQFIDVSEQFVFVCLATWTFFTKSVTVFGMSAESVMPIMG